MVRLALLPEPRAKARNLPTRYGARDVRAQANRIRHAGPALRCFRADVPAIPPVRGRSGYAERRLWRPPLVGRDVQWRLVGGIDLDGRRDREAAGLGLFALLDVDFEHAVGVVRPSLDVVSPLG
jgi:hypothetical protein